MKPPAAASTPSSKARPAAPGAGLRWVTPLNVLLLAVPAAAALKFSAAPGAWVFAAAGLGIVPLAGYMGRATEALAGRLGSAAGGLLNATFGNAAELIIALIVLFEGPRFHPLVKATITGSIIGNLL